MAKLSHSGHTQSPQSISGWKEEWPDLEDIFNFWFFGLRKQGLLPTPDELKDEASMIQWATKMNLTSELHKVPDWVLFVAANQEGFKDLFEDRLDARSYALNLPSTFTGLPSRPMPITPKHAQKAASITFSAMLEIPAHDLPLSFRTSMKELVTDSEAALKKHLRFNPTVESKAKAKRRIMKSFELWLDVQLHWVNLATLDRVDRNISSVDLEKFIRFQCKCESVGSIVHKRRPKDDLNSIQSATRKMLKKVADRLQLRLRVGHSGRPRKNKTMESD